jgi:hypothetical protein
MGVIERPQNAYLVECERERGGQRGGWEGCLRGGEGAVCCVRGGGKWLCPKWSPRVGKRGGVGISKIF